MPVMMPGAGRGAVVEVLGGERESSRNGAPGSRRRSTRSRGSSLPRAVWRSRERCAAAGRARAPALAQVGDQRRWLVRRKSSSWRRNVSTRSRRCRRAGHLCRYGRSCRSPPRRARPGLRPVDAVAGADEHVGDDAVGGASIDSSIFIDSRTTSDVALGHGVAVPTRTSSTVPGIGASSEPPAARAAPARSSDAAAAPRVGTPSSAEPRRSSPVADRPRRRRGTTPDPVDAPGRPVARRRAGGRRLPPSRRRPHGPSSRIARRSPRTPPSRQPSSASHGSSAAVARRAARRPRSAGEVRPAAGGGDRVAEALDQPRVELPARTSGRASSARRKAALVVGADDAQLRERAVQPRQRRRAVGAVRRSPSPAAGRSRCRPRCRPRCPSRRARPRRRLAVARRPCRVDGQEAGGRVLGVQRAPRPRGRVGATSSCAERQRLARRDAQLQLDEVEAGDQLGDRVLDLQPGVDLEEVEARRLVGVGDSSTVPAPT